MKKTTLWLKITQHLAQKEVGIKRSPKGDAGYTLLELLVVIILIGAIAAIGAPSWFGFLSQRQVNASNDLILRALQEAQSQAKNKKQSYSLSLRASTGEVPKIAIHRSSSPPSSSDIPPDNSPLWRSLGQDLAIKPGKIWIGTNADSTTNNKAGNSLNSVSNYSDSKVTAVTFDYMGNLLNTPNTPDLGSNSQGLIIAVGAGLPNSNPVQPIPPTRRCVRVNTLLGSIQVGKIQSTSVDECQPK